LIGAQLGGLLGALLAIPVASTLGTLAAEWLLPEVRRLAGQRAPDEGAAPGAP
jgi:predicted PurR-regulated permease PerM